MSYLWSLSIISEVIPDGLAVMDGYFQNQISLLQKLGAGDDFDL